jgi:hypothetical protein
MNHMTIVRGMSSCGLSATAIYDKRRVKKRGGWSSDFGVGSFLVTWVAKRPAVGRDSVV